jgi:phage FluMu protein Com
MLNDQILESLECASISSTTFSHLVHNPLTLSCGHSICKECVPSNDNIRIKCSHCKEINQTYLKTQKVSHSTVSLFNAFLKQLFNLLEERFKVAIHEATRKLIQHKLSH